MIKTTTREIASSSDVNAPVFYFKEYVRGLEYHNNGRQIDFVTDGNSLYVPSTDNVTACKDSIKEDGGFMRLVSEGKQGIQGLKGDPGRDGRTPSVFARFDGRQMIFYTNEINEDGTPKIDDKGNPVTRRIAATNDLTGPSWRPKKVDDTIIWEKTRDDSQPESINLSDLVKETAPVIFRVDSDNTKRSDETSGPANYIQWKYEGDEYWNNLISISELMNLALAGVCIWFDEDDQEYHLGHRQVLHATYDSSKTGKKIISDVEHGDILYDAGPIHLPDFEADIAALWEEVCALKDRVEDIEEELPQFIKKSDIAFEVREEQDGRFLYMSLDGRSTWTKIIEATCVCKKEVDPTIYYTIFFETPTPSTAIMTYSGVVKYPGSQIRVPAGTTVVLEADAEGYKHYKETQLINADYHFKPVLTKESAPEVKYSACVIDETGSADRIYIGTISANKQQACLENLSNGTTVYGKATRSGYKDKTVSGVINNDNLELPITGEWESSTVPVDYVRIGEGDTYTMYVGDTHCFTANVRPDNATNKNVTWSVSNRHAEVDSNGCVVALSATEPTVTLTVRTIDGDKEYDCVITILERETPPETTLSINPSTLNFEAAGGNKDFTVSTNADSFSVSEKCDWITVSQSNNTVTVTAAVNTGDERNCNITVTAGDKEASVSISQAAYVAPEPNKYILTVNGNGAESITVNGNSYTGPMEIEEGTTVNIVATRTNYTPSYDKNNFTMTKDTSVNITWTAVGPDDHPVTSVTINNKPTDNTITWNCSNDQTHALSATVSPENATRPTVSWSSTNTNVATIDSTSGLITVVGTGTTTIRATADSKFDEFVLTINRPAVTEITLNKTTTTLIVGGNEKLTVTHTPSCATDTISWTSSDTNVATVSDGTIAALTPGTATITATANGKIATCEVTVNAAPVTGYILHVQSSNVPSGAEITVTYGGSDHTGPNDFTIEAGTNVKISAELEGYTPSYSIVPEGVISSATDFSMPAREFTIMIGWSKDNVPVEGISVNASEITVDKGQCVNPSIIVTVSPSDATDKSYKWTSDDLTIATISEDGTNLCGINIGTTTITVTTNGKNIDDEYETAKVTVHVVTPDYNIVLPEETIFNVGERKTITATITGTGEPSGPITWNFINMGDSSPFANITNVSPDGLTAEITATQNPGQIGIEAKVESDNKRGGGTITVINPYTIESIKSVYYDANGNPVTNTYSVNSQSISLPTWSSIQFGVSGSGRDAVSHSEDFIGSVCQGPVETSGSTYYYNYDMYCIDSENQQPIQDGDGTIVFGNLTINMSWNGTYGNPIYQDKENPYSPIQ